MIPGTRNDLDEILIKNGFDPIDFNMTEHRSGQVFGIVNLSYQITRISNSITFEYDNHWMTDFIEDLESLKYGNP